MRRFRPVLVALLASLVLTPPTAIAGVGPDYVSSDNIELVNRIKTVGDGVGGRIIGDYLFVTSTKSLNIFDIKTDPENPREVGLETMDVEFENEEVPTNGKLLGISGQYGCKDATELVLGEAGPSTGCLSLYDVTDPANVRFIRSVGGAGDHTQTCVYDCQYFFGSEGTVVDARDPANAKIIGNWGADSSCHHVREIKPGIILTSCQPTQLISVRPEDGGSILKPVEIALATNEDERFIHSSRWPRDGEDKFMFSGGETNAQPQCDDTVAAFMVWDASAVRSGSGGFTKGAQFKLLDEVRPVNGSYVDGHSPVNGLGCSVHWFSEHPQFRDGGAVALAEYENGTRLLQITPEGKIVEQGFFLPLAGSTSSPFWNPNGKVIYTIDYTRGIDVLRYTGPSYVPDATGTVPAEPGTTPGTGGAAPGTTTSTDAAACASAAGFKSVGAKGVGSGVQVTATRRQARAFDVEIFQQSSGRTLLDNRLRARFKGRRASFVWNGRDARGRRVSNGQYFVRYTMKLANGQKDVRRVTLVRKGGKFTRSRDFYQRTDCGVFRSFKLSSSAFGGRGNTALGISYRLARGANAVTIEAFAGKRKLKSFRGGTVAGRSYSLSLPSRGLKRGQVVTVRAMVKTGTPVATQLLYAVRL